MTSVILPASVVEIGDYAFDECLSLTSITISGNVKKVGQTAFAWCDNLKEAVFLDGVTEIPADMFSSVGSALTSVRLPGTLVSIGDRAFAYVGISSITLPDSVTTLGDRAFFHSSLTKITLPSHAMKLGEELFAECASLTNIEILGNLTEIPSGMFTGCSSLTAFAVPEGVTTIGDRAFYKSGLTSIVIPSSVTKLGEDLFNGCRSLTEVEIRGEITEIPAGMLANTAVASFTVPDSVTVIGENAFRCLLQEITLPKNLVEIKDDAFGSEYDDSEPLTVNYPGNASAWNALIIGTGNERLIKSSGYAIHDEGTLGAFDQYHWEIDGSTLTVILTFPQGGDMSGDMPWKKYATIIKKVVLDEGVWNIPDSAFEDCYKLREVSIASTVDTIGKRAFAGCQGLNSVSLPEGLTEIAESAFRGSGLKEIALPSTVETIGDYAFSGCTSLSKVTVPVGLKSIGIGAFLTITDQDTLTTVEYDGTETQWKAIDVSIKNEQLLTASPFGVKDSGTAGTVSWSFDGTTLTLTAKNAGRNEVSSYGYPEGPAASEGELAPWQRYAGLIQSIVLPENTDFGARSFRNFPQLREIVIPEGTEVIGDYAFYSVALEKVYLPKSLKTVGTGALSESLIWNGMYVKEFPGYDIYHNFRVV